MTEETRVERVIEAFGGSSKLAKLLNIDKQLVHSWKRTGSVPMKYRKDLILIRAELNIDVEIEDICL
jgi:hypothetical protein